MVLIQCVMALSVIAICYPCAVCLSLSAYIRMYIRMYADKLICVCTCVSLEKHAYLRLTAQKSPRKLSLQLFSLNLYVKKFSVLASLA